MGERYGGLDVLDKLTHICVLDGAGALVWRGRCASEAEVIAATLRSRARATPASFSTMISERARRPFTSVGAMRKLAAPVR